MLVNNTMNKEPCFGRDNYVKRITHLNCGLGAQKEKELSRIIKHSNKPKSKQKAIDELVNGNLGLVLGIAREIFNGYHGNLSYMDLVTEGNFWLFYASRHFSYKRKCRFSTYAYPIIRWHILAAINSDTTIHIPINLFNHRKAARALRDIHGKLTKEILMKGLGVLGGVANNINDAMSSSVSSLDKHIDNTIDVALIDTIRDEKAPDPSVEANKTILKEYLDATGKECLSIREQKIIDLMFYDNGGMILRDMAKQMGVSRERVRQIYERAIRKLRKKFFNEWDSKHAEDRIDNEKVYREATGSEGFCYNYRMRQTFDEKFQRKIDEKMNEKGQKILRSLT